MRQPQPLTTHYKLQTKEGLGVEMRKVIYNEAQLIKEKLYEISDYIYNNPELGNQEYKAVEALTRFLKEHGFEIECPYAGMDTAFKATFDSGKEGKNIGYLCEYDALPEIGHGCGHNMIGAMSCGAGVSLSKVLSNSSRRNKWRKGYFSRSRCI